MPLPRWIKALSNIERIPEIWNSIILTKSWWKFTCAYLKLGRIDYPLVLATRSGTQIELNNFHDCVTAWVVFCRNEYSVPTEAKVIVDLGANFGAFTLLAAYKARESHIISVEPFPTMFERLCENVAVNGLRERVNCLPLAVAKVSGERRMSLDEGPDQSRGILSEETVATENSVSVKTISLAELIEYVQVNLETDQIDLVKMDIEGAEHEFLPGIPAETLQAIQAWQMEYHPNGSKQLLFKALENAGFNCIEDKVISCNCGVAHFKRDKFKNFAVN
jgi:FkbM family methyltransferase